MIAETYDDLLAVGEAYERHVVARLRAAGVRCARIEGYRNQLAFGDTDIGLEVKCDRQVHLTGNVFVEVAEKRTADRPRWTPSGAFRDDACRFYGVGNYRCLFVWRKATLRDEARARRIITIGRGTSQGFLLRAISQLGPEVPPLRVFWWRDYLHDGRLDIADAYAGMAVMI